MIAGAEADESGESDVVGVVVLDVLLAAQGVDDGSLERRGGGDEFVVRFLASGAGEDGDLLSCIENVCGLAELFVVGTKDGSGIWMGSTGLLLTASWRKISPGMTRTATAGAGDGGAHGDLEQARHLFGDADHLAVVAALFEEILRMGLLKVAGADLVAGDMCGDGEDGNTAAVAVEEAVDEVQVAGTAAGGADGERAGEVGFGSGGEGSDLFVADVRPLEGAIFADSVGEAVEGISRKAVDAFDACVLEAFHDDFRDCLCHAVSLRAQSYFTR